MGYKLYSNIICQIQQKVLWKILEKEYSKLFSKYEMFFLNQSNFSSNLFQVLILQYHNHWMYQTICQAKLIKFIIKLYIDQNTLLVKHHQKKSHFSLKVRQS